MSLKRMFTSGILATAVWAASASAQDVRVLERELARIAEGTDGMLGVAAIHLESGLEVFLNGDEPFPMASSYKVPIAVQLLTLVQNGEVRLDSMVEIGPTDLHPGSGTISYLLDDPGVVLSVRNLLELMLLISDNSATDLVLDASGGATAVTERMTALGVEGIRVARPTVELISDWIGLQGADVHALSRDSLGSLYAQVSSEAREAGRRAFRSDPRDTATPRGMATLLAKLGRGEALDEARTALLLDIMTRSTTGANRIKGLLPPNVDVAHKTGTIGGTTNDVGIMTLPDDAGRVAIVTFVKDAEQPTEDRERVIAHAARAVYDFFLFAR